MHPNKANDTLNESNQVCDVAQQPRNEVLGPRAKGEPNTIAGTPRRHEPGREMYMDLKMKGAPTSRSNPSVVLGGT